MNAGRRSASSLRACASWLRSLGLFRLRRLNRRGTQGQAEAAVARAARRGERAAGRHRFPLRDC